MLQNKLIQERSMKKFLLFFALGSTLGCATGVMRPYVGEQQAWPTSQGSIVNTKYELPIFTSLPPCAYDIVGELRIDSFFFAQPEEQHIGQLVTIAKKQKADALALVDGQIFFSVSYGSKDGSTAGGAATSTTMQQVNRFNPESFRPGVSVLAIKWVDAAPGTLPSKYHHSIVSAIPAKPSVIEKKAPVVAPAKTPATKTNFSTTKPTADAR
jgi:hypothetical protein